MYSIKQANNGDACRIEEMAHKAYWATYSDILSMDQISFMLQKNYTPEAIQASMSVGQDFYILYDRDNSTLGFIALQQKEDDILRIEKLYLLPAGQGLGLGRELISFANGEAKRRNLSALELNVNREIKLITFT